MYGSEWHWPAFTEEEGEAVRQVLLSNRVNYWTGNLCREFEREFAEWVGVEYAVALANGTVALELALRALGIGSGDDVIVTPRTFFASASSIVAVGANPVFADIDRDSQNITVESIEPAATSRTRAIICVHLAGWPCDMPAIMSFAKDKNMMVIEDCAQAHGASCEGRSVGSFADIGAWSFCQDKIISTGGEGGMVTTNSRDLWSRVWSYKDHGKSWDAAYGQHHGAGFRWLHNTFGTNARMFEMQAALGRIQLTRMTDWHAQRVANAQTIWQACRGIPGLRVPDVPVGVEHAAYKCYVFVKPEMLRNGWSRDRIMTEVNARGVPCFSGSCSEVYLEKAFSGTVWRPSQRLPIAAELAMTSLMFLVHPTLPQRALARACGVLEDVMADAVR